MSSMRPQIEVKKNLDNIITASTSVLITNTAISISTSKKPEASTTKDSTSTNSSELKIQEQPSRSSNKQGVTAKERFSYINQLLSENPDLGMTDPAPKLYEALYLKDRAVIEAELKQRTQKEVLLKDLEEVDEFVKNRGYKNKMSFGDYNFVASWWVRILSKTEDDSSKCGFGKLTEEYDQCLKYLHKGPRYFNGSLTNCHYLLASGIVVPHISKTGALSIPLMNEGYGFFVKNRARSVHYLAVGTDPKLNFDYLRGQTCFYNWYHDWEHIQRGGFFCNDQDSKELILNIAKLRKQISETLSDPKEIAQAELAFFMVFHESQGLLPHPGALMEFLDKGIKQKTDEIKSDLLPKEKKGFSSKEQYETYVKAATSLKLPVAKKSAKLEGDALLVEQFRDFLKHYIAGCNLLKQFAKDYDCAFANDNQTVAPMTPSFSSTNASSNFSSSASSNNFFHSSSSSSSSSSINSSTHVDSFSQNSSSTFL